MPNKTRPNQQIDVSEHLRLKPLSACIRIALAGGVLMGYVTPGFAQNNVLPIPAQVWSTFGSATHQTIGNTLQINQTSDRAILNWEKFNVGTKNQVKFQQPNSTSIALNRIFQDDPSQILGKITANGQIYLYNKNGFVFGKDSTVNANTLVASALNISPDVFKTSGIVNYFKDSGGGAALVAEPGSSKAVIDVKAGAKIHIGENGRLIMAAPTVTNAGSIDTDKFGQIVLVASKDKVYLQPTDSTTNKDFAGLLVEVGTGGQVTNANLGNILARQGNVTLAGFAVNQSGRISATTATNVNGSIRLLAREGGINKGGTLESSTTIRSEDQNDGLGTKAKVTFASGSKTQIIADSESGKAIDGQKQPLSYMQVSAHTVHLQSGSALGVPGGKINIEASINPSVPTSTTDSNNQPNNQGRIILDSGALIDVSGTKNITASVSRNVVGVPVQSFELRDSPLQKGGVLQGQTIQVDIRDKTPIVDTSGAEALIERGIDERLGKGGTINLTSAGDVIVNPGAKINISGGTINYQAGYINTSKLLTDYGKIIDISDADPNEHYQAVFGAYKEVHEKWGVTKIWQADSLFGKGQFEQGYQEGLDAGALNITTANLSWNGDLVAGAASGLFQRDATSKAFGGEFSINNNGQNFFNPTQNVLFQTQANGLNLTVDEEFPVDNDNQPADLVLSTDSINHSGIQKLSIKTQGNATIASGAKIEMTPGKTGEITKLPTVESISPITEIIKGSQFNLVADDIDVQGSILAAGGNIKLTSGTNPGSVDPLLGFTTGLLTVGPKANLDVSGLWVNDFALGLDATPTEDIVTDAGSVSLTATGGLDLQSGSAIHADGGAWLTQNGQLTAGKGGAINLATEKVREDDIFFHLNGKLSAYSLSEGGSLSLAPFAEKIILGVPDDADLLSSPLVLGVNDGYLDIDGIKSFGKINVSGGLNLTVKENTTLNLIQQNWLLNDNYQQQASGNSIAAFSKIETLPDHLRKPVDLSLSSESINLETGSKILGDKQATIKLAATGLGGIYVDGLIDAPAGTIDLKILASDAADYVPSQAIWLGQHGQLQAKGTTILNPLDALGKVTGDVLDGGNISLSTNRGYVILEDGSKIDVSGTNAKLDILSADPGSTHTVSTQVGSNAGKITLQAAEGGVFDGELLGLAGSATTNGGRLDLILDRLQRPISDILPPPFGSLTLNVQQDYTKQLDDKVQFGANLDELGLNGKATIGSDKITDGGFDDLRLKVINVKGLFQLTEKDTFVNFLGDVNLSVGNLIDIDAPAIGWLGLNDATTGSVSLNTAYLRVGSSRFELREPTQLPISGGGKFTANTLWTEFGGGSRWDGFKTLNFKSQHDIRAVGVLKEEPDTEAVPKNSSDFVGKLMTAADINFTASQIYPSTLTKFTFAVANNPTGKITVSPSGNSDISPLSAGGVLNLEASVINQNGTIKAPFGTINLTASKSLSLGNGSLTSVSGAGQLIPFGVISAGQDWLYPLQQTSLVLNAPPEKKLVLSAPEVNIKKGSTVDLSGGGDLLAYEFQPGIGGSFDYLDSNSPSYNGGFAILPNLGSSLAPFDHAQGLLGNYQAAVGSQVFLNGTDKLAAGFYTILPARYALLPGAFLITPQAETQDQKATTINAAGLPVVGGFQTLAGTGTKDARWSGFLIESGSDVRKHSQYEEVTANNFYTQLAASKETITPILPKDSGQIVIKNAQTKLSLDGDFKVSSPGGRGARMDIAADRLKIVKALSATPTAGILEVLADDLTDLNVGSLLLGGERTSNINTGATNISVSSEEVVFDKNAHVQATDLIVAATQKITVKKGAELIAKGSVTTGDKILNISGDGALLKLSSDQPVSLNRTQALRNAGELLVEAGATLSANKSMLVDASQSTKIFGDIQMQGGSLNLSANTINIGEVGSLLSNDLNLSNSDLSKLTVDELILTGRETINFYGNVGKLDGTGILNPLTFDRLVINAAGLSGFGKGNKSVGLQANSILFQNTFGVTSSKQGTGSGELNISATSYNQGNGIFNINGFNSVNIDAAKDFTAMGNGTLNINSNLHLTSGYIASSAGKKLNINAIGHQALFDSHANTNVPTITDFGGAVNVTANAINFNAEAALPSGQLGLHSLNGDIQVGSQAQIDLAGRKVRFADTFDYTSGGTFSAIADQGKIVLAAGSKVDVSTGGGKAAGGKLDLQAAKQNVELLGELKAKAGSATLDVARFSVKSGFDSLMDALMVAGVSNELSVRSRKDTIEQGSGNSITANKITLSSDQGDVILSGKLNSDGISQGGVIKVYAGDKVSLVGAKLSAKGTASGAVGGKVLLSSTDADSDHKSGIEINSESSIDVSGGSKGNGGEVVLRALRTDSDNNGVDDGVAIKPIAADVVTGFSGFYAEGVKKYSNQDFFIPGEINEFDIFTIKDNTDTYMTSENIKHVSNTLGKDLGIHLRPGIEINYDGDLTLKSQWDFVSWGDDPVNFGEKSYLPGTLNINVSGNFTLEKSLTDGFKVDDFGFGRDILQTNDSWSYQLTAGADLTSADKSAVDKQAKNITLATSTFSPTDTYIRTGTGDIELNASGNLIFQGGLAFDDFGTPLLVKTAVYNAGKAEAGNRYGSFSDDYAQFFTAAYSDYPLAGGDLAIKVGGDINGTVSQETTINNWLNRQGGKADASSANLPTAWGIDFAKFSQNVGSFGGGNVDINADGNINDLTVMMPTNGKQVGEQLIPGDGASGYKTNLLQIGGGGQLHVNAGADIAGGIYYLGKGNGTINANGAITGSSNSSLDPDVFSISSVVDLTKGPQLLMGDTNLTITANAGIGISAVSDPMIFDDSGTNFFSYSEDSSISLKSLSGDVRLSTDNRVVTNISDTTDPQYALSKIYPASLHSTAFGGSVLFEAVDEFAQTSDIILFPSAKADLTILAKDNIGTPSSQTIISKIGMSDFNPSLLPNALTPIINFDPTDGTPSLAGDNIAGKLFPFVSGVFGSLVHSQTPVHLGDQEPVRIVTQQGNIENIIFNLPKKAIIASGRDLNNASFSIQHANQKNDVSVITAARDIIFSALRNQDKGILENNEGTIEIAGSGDVLIQSGRNIDLGTSAGISTIANNNNPSLQNSGANITVLAGLNGATPNYLGFEKLDANILKYAEKYDEYQALVTEFMRQRTGNTKLTTKTAFEQFNKLAPSEYASLQPQFNNLTSTKYTDLISKMKQTMVQFMRQRTQNPTLTDANALVGFTKLKSEETVAIQTQLNTFANEILFTELNETNSVSATDPLAGNERGFNAIETLYPGNAWNGDLNLVFSTLQTQKGGNINLLVPGGNINVGLPVAGVVKEAKQLGIIASGTGTINAFLDKDFNVNQSRVFALGGDDINIWTSHGNIDAGRGAKSALAVSDPVFSFDENGNLIVDFPPPVAGSGIRTAAPLNKLDSVVGGESCKTNPDLCKPGNVRLSAPLGIVNAGEAGIGGNNVTISATAVLGANNIQVGGVGTGIPSASTASLAAGLTGVSNLTANVSQMAQASADMGKDNDKDEKKKKQLGTISVELIGFGT